MSVPVKGSFVGRFALKFVEVLGAGVATAVGSYFVAQLSGYWSSPAHAPATVQIAPSNSSLPNASVVSKAPRGDPEGAKLAPSPDTPAPAASAARATATANSAASRKRAPVEANAEAKSPEKEAKPPEKEAKPQEKETAETKARDKDDKDSVEAQVRAALANVDASRQPPPATQVAAPAAVPKTEPPPSPGTVAAVPRGADVAPPPATPPGPSPTLAEPLTPVEIKSHPIADVDAAAQAQADAGARAEASQGNDKGLFAALKKIPEFFRTDAHPPDDPPRPPKQVGE